MRVTAADLVDRVAEAKLKVTAVRYKVEGEVRSTAEKFKSRVSEAKAKLGDEARFIKSWIDDPRRTGSVTPSSPALARRMASFVDPEQPGPVIEIGPGTGPVTEALIERGIDESRLILVEYSPEFCELLSKRFPRATIVQGDAYALSATLAGHLQEKAIALVSSLPLFNRPPATRSALAREAFPLGEVVGETWRGARPTLPDSLPMIGEAPRNPGLWLAFGNQHIGFSTGPITGELIAAMVCGEKPPIDPTPFRPERYIR